MTFTDDFFKAFNQSRCKTAMLLISVIVSFAFAISEVGGSPSQPLEAGFILVVGYWSGRTSKARDRNA